MTVMEIAVLVLLLWLLVGIITVKLASRAGYTWGWFDGDGWGCRAWVVLQAPGALLDTLLKDVVHLGREEPLVGAHARVLWRILLDPKLDPDIALERDEPTS